MELKDFQEFIASNRQNLRGSAREFLWNIVKLPIEGDMSAVYGEYEFEQEKIRVPQALRLMGYAKAGQFFPYEEETIMYTFENSLNVEGYSAGLKNQLIAALAEKAVSIVRAEDMNSDAAAKVEIMPGVVNKMALSLFMGDNDGLDFYDDLKAGIKDAQPFILSALPDYEQAARNWLGLETRYESLTYRHKLLRKMVALEKAKVQAAEWENEPDSAPYIVREILNALAQNAPSAKNIVATLDGPRGPVQATFPAEEFSRHTAQTGTISLWHITPEKVRKSVEEQLAPEQGNGHYLVSGVSVDRISEISYRGKTVYKKGE